MPIIRNSPSRFEVIVTFGNSGPRGGSGASGKNIDINGNGSIDTQEACVRSVPTRLTVAVPGGSRVVPIRACFIAWGLVLRPPRRTPRSRPGPGAGQGP